MKLKTASDSFKDTLFPGEEVMPETSISNASPSGGSGAVSINSASALLEPLRALQNPGLITSVYPLTIGATRHEILKSLVLGKRAGGTPIRLGLFGGLDVGATETVAAASKILMLLTLGPSLAQDFAVFGYPLVNPAGFRTDAVSASIASELALRWKSEAYATDALFFRAEFQRVSPNGIITLRSSQNPGFLRARVNSRVIAEEVVKPALQRLKGLVAVEENPVTLFSMEESERRMQFAGGRLMPNPETQPWPFEVELEVPAQAAFEVKMQALVLATLDILRSYRAFVCHGGDL